MMFGFVPEAARRRHRRLGKINTDLAIQRMRGSEEDRLRDELKRAVVELDGANRARSEVCDAGLATLKSLTDAEADLDREIAEGRRLRAEVTPALRGARRRR